MRVSNDTLEYLLGRPNVTLEKDPQRRGTRRVAVSKRAMLCRLGSAVQIPITIIDVSAGGIGFIFSMLPRFGAQHILRVARRDQSAIALQCRVRWGRKTRTGRFQVGAEFLRMLE